MPDKMKGGLPYQTRDTGALVGDNDNTLTAGPRGPQLLQDAHHIEKLSRFDRERIPERVVHARGTGAFGTFRSTADFSKYTSMPLLSKAGNKIDAFVRFSTVIGSKGSPETARDPRGFAVRLFTDEGNWDIVGNNLPVFFIRDSMKFPDMVHSLKPNPRTNVQEPNRFFDFFSLQPESTHMLTQVYSDLGIPASYSTMDGNGVHAYKLINSKGKVTYVKFNWKSAQGVKNLTMEEAAEVQSTNANHLTTGLYEDIDAKKFPSWDLRVQLIAPEDLDNFDFDPLDATKIWTDIPFETIGRLTLNKVPNNFFQSTEQAAFCPSNFVRGVEPSEDRLLQGRLFSYFDTQLYRLGSPNFKDLPINRPKSAVRNHHADGILDFGDTVDIVNYNPSRLSPQFTAAPGARFAETPLMGTFQQMAINKTLNFRQAGELYRSFTTSQRSNLVKNLAADLSQVTNGEIKNTMCAHFYKADNEYGQSLSESASCDMSQVKRIASQLQE